MENISLKTLRQKIVKINPIMRQKRNFCLQSKRIVSYGGKDITNYKFYEELKEEEKEKNNCERKACENNTRAVKIKTQKMKLKSCENNNKNNKIKGKAMIRNRYNYPIPPIRDIKGKETQQDPLTKV